RPRRAGRRCPRSRSARSVGSCSVPAEMVHWPYDIPSPRSRASPTAVSRLRLILLGLAVLFPAGMVVAFILKSRVNSDRIACENPLRELGLVAVRHASPPGEGLPTIPKDELPPGTFQNSILTPDQRMSWYVYTLNALIENPLTTDPTIKH